MHYVKFDGKEYERCSEISQFSNDDLLIEFKSIVEKLSKKDNVMKHIKDRSKDKHFTKFYVSYENPESYCLRFVPFAGSGSIGKTKLNFYQLINPNTILKGLYKNLCNNNKFKLYIVFKDEDETNNFINFSKTIFCMGCLYLKKHTLNLYADETSLIPWFDFSNPIFSKSPAEIDDYLFDKFNISDEIRQHIEELLPD